MRWSRRLSDGALAAEFPIGRAPEGDLVASITYCDLSVGPTGVPTTADERVEEILTRYQSGDLVHRVIERAKPSLLDQYARVQALLAV